MRKEKVIIIRVKDNFKSKVKIRAEQLELDMSKYLIHLIEKDLMEKDLKKHGN